MFQNERGFGMTGGEEIPEIEIYYCCQGKDFSTLEEAKVYKNLCIEVDFLAPKIGAIVGHHINAYQLTEMLLLHWKAIKNVMDNR